MVEWQRFSGGPARRAPCLYCGTLSPWRPKGWWFRFRGVRKSTRKGGEKLRTERVCGSCYREGDQIHDAV